MQSYTLDDTATYVNDDGSNKNSLCSILTAEDNTHEQLDNYDVLNQIADNSNDESNDTKNAPEKSQENSAGNAAKKLRICFRKK